MAERLRRLTWNQIPSGSVGSNPTSCEALILYRQMIGLNWELLCGIQFSVTGLNYSAMFFETKRLCFFCLPTNQLIWLVILCHGINCVTALWPLKFSGGVPQMTLGFIFFHPSIHFMTSILMELIQQIPESLSWRITTSVCSQLQPTGSHEQNWNVFKEMNPYIFNQ